MILFELSSCRERKLAIFKFDSYCHSSSITSCCFLVMAFLYQNSGSFLSLSHPAKQHGEYKQGSNHADIWKREKEIIEVRCYLRNAFTCCLLCFFFSAQWYVFQSRILILVQHCFFVVCFFVVFNDHGRSYYVRILAFATNHLILCIFLQHLKVLKHLFFL